MSVGLPSDEVAEDYKNSLEDLTINSRYEISNLTVIAKENTEHAMAISRVLENHIKTVSTHTHSRMAFVMAGSQDYHSDDRARIFTRWILTFL